MLRLEEGTGEPASSGDCVPASAFPVQSPRGLAFDPFGNLVVTATHVVRLVTADGAGVVDGGGRAITLYGAAPRTQFPQDSTSCLSDVVARTDGAVHVTDACIGVLIELARSPP